MKPQDLADLTPQETWVSAFVDGEAGLSDHADWCETVHEQFYYYTIARQVVRGDPACQDRDGTFLIQRANWAAFWARIDAA